MCVYKLDSSYAAKHIASNGHNKKTVTSNSSLHGWLSRLHCSIFQRDSEPISVDFLAYA